MDCVIGLVIHNVTIKLVQIYLSAKIGCDPVWLRSNTKTSFTSVDVTCYVKWRRLKHRVLFVIPYWHDHLGADLYKNRSCNLINTMYRQTKKQIQYNTKFIYLPSPCYCNVFGLRRHIDIVARLLA